MGGIGGAGWNIDNRTGVHHFPYLDPVNSRNKLDNQNAARPGITERAVQTALSPFNQSLFNLY